jgi:serine/threonine protein kinase
MNVIHLKAVSHCHSNSIVHFDVKPGNVLSRVINGGLEVVLTDFDVAAKIGETPLVGTLEYLAPEFLELKREQVGTPVDIWAVGIMFAELVI